MLESDVADAFSMSSNVGTTNTGFVGFMPGFQEAIQCTLISRMMTRVG